MAVEIAYRIRGEESPRSSKQPVICARHAAATARPSGALYRDLAEPSRYVERFIVTSWADYLHQRSRATLADQELEARVRSFLLSGEAVTMQHYIAER